MSRTVSKSIVSSVVSVFDPSIKFTLDSNGMPIANRTFEMSGSPTLNRARIQAQKKFGRNVLVLNIDVDESKISVSPADFIAHSDICKTGESYGREYVTQTFKVTFIDGFYTDENGMHIMALTYEGTTTANKLHNYACECYNTQNVVITNTKVIDERRYMPRELYLKLATDENDENANA